MRWIGVLFAVGCGSTSFHGTVVDHRGTPVEDALVTVVGNLCQQKTDATGHFELSCSSAKGEVTLSAGKEGFISAERSVSVSSGEAHPLETVELIGVPTGEATLYLRDGDADRVPEYGHILKRLEERNEAVATFCLLPDTPENVLTGKQLTVFDRGHEGWRLWMVGEDGCVYKKKRVDRGKWERTFGDKLAMQTTDLGGQMKLHTLDLEAGRYWIGEWENGFFAQDRTKEGPVHYRGHVVTVP